MSTVAKDVDEVPPTAVEDVDKVASTTAEDLGEVVSRAIEGVDKDSNDLGLRVGLGYDLKDIGATVTVALAKTFTSA